MWKDVRDSENYEVNEKGQIRNKRTQRILMPSANGLGTLKVMFSEDGIHVNRTVARTVGEAFVDGYEEGFVIFFKDDDGFNTDATNLEWRPRWFAQEWAYQSKRTEPMRPWPIVRNLTGVVYKNSLDCAKATWAIEKYIVFACGRGDTIYNGSTYQWIRE